MPYIHAPMFAVVVSGMLWDVFPTYQEAIEVALSLGCGARVRKYEPAVAK